MRAAERKQIKEEDPIKKARLDSALVMRTDRSRNFISNLFYNFMEGWLETMSLPGPWKLLCLFGGRLNNDLQNKHNILTEYSAQRLRTKM